MADVQKQDEYWFLNISDKVMAVVRQHLKSKGYQIVKNVAPDTLAKFPSIYYTELNPLEIGNDLDNTQVNAVRCTIEVRVYVNTGSNVDCETILKPIISDFKSFRFDCQQFPIYTKFGNVVRGVMRFSRIVGSGDEDLTYVTVKS